MNVDPQEVKKFDDIAQNWWDKSGPCKPLHDLNPVRLAFIQANVTLANQHILDVGCGGGILSESLSRFNAKVIGLDLSENALEAAKDHAKDLASPPSYELATIESYATLHPNKFDVITCMEMLEHVPHPISVVQSIATLLKPGGHLFFSTLNRTPKAFLQAIIGAEYIMRMLPRGTHEYERFIRPSELAEWAQSYSLILKHLKGVSYNLFSKTFFLSNDVSVNYMMHLQKEAD